MYRGVEASAKESGGLAPGGEDRPYQARPRRQDPPRVRAEVELLTGLGRKQLERRVLSGQAARS